MAWRNWAGNQHMEPAHVVRPSSAEQIAAVVRRAAERGHRVKAIGAGHSFTGIGLTDGVLVDLSRYDGLVAVDATRVTVQAGMRLRTLNALLADAGLGLTNMGDVDVQTVSGAISTGTHGTGRDSAGLAAQVVGLEVVLADGSVVACDATRRADLFSAARLGLGALGILSTVTLQAEPAFLLAADERPLPLDDVLDGFEELVATNDHAEFYWFPHTDVALTKRNNRTDAPAAPLSRARALLDDELLSNTVFGATCRLGSRMPTVVPRLNRLAARALTARTYVAPAPAVFTSPRRVRFVEMEYAVPRAALAGVFSELRTLPERYGLTVSFPVEVRVAPADDVPLSTASGRDTAYVAVHVFHGDPHARYFDAVESLMASVDGRPHWGKVHGLDAARLRALYPRLDEFVAVRDAVDPERRFGNAYLDRVLG